MILHKVIPMLVEMLVPISIETHQIYAPLLAVNVTQIHRILGRLAPHLFGIDEPGLRFWKVPSRGFSPHTRLFGISLLRNMAHV
jgi:hypothetical protein